MLYKSIITTLLAFILIACGSNPTSEKEELATKLTATQKLHRAIFSQDPIRIQDAIDHGADVNALIRRRDYKKPPVEISVEASTPLNAVISDYKYKDSKYVAPLPRDASHIEVSTLIIKQLLIAGARLDQNQFFSINKFETTFELGGTRLAFALPLMMTTGFVPNQHDLLNAFQHYDVFKQVALKYDGFENLLDQIYARKDLPSKIEKFKQRFKREKNDSDLENELSRLEEKRKKELFQNMRKYAAQFTFPEEHHYIGIKLCVFNDYEVTVGFAQEFNEEKVLFKPAYKYNFDHAGIERGSRTRDKREALWLTKSTLASCPGSA